MELFTLSIAITNLVGVILTAQNTSQFTQQQQECPVYRSPVACVQSYFPTHTKSYYSTEWLKTRSCLQPSTTILHCLQTELQSAGILKTNKKGKKTTRGKRAGRRKQRKIKVIISERISDTVVFSGHRKQNVIKVKLSSDQVHQSVTPKNSCDKIKLLLLNLQSVGTNANSINNLICDSNADFIFFTETWLLPKGDEVKTEAMTPSHYKAKSFPRLTGGGPGGGIFVLIKNSFKNTKFKIISDYRTFECSKSEIVLNNIPIIFYCVYRPPPSAKNGFTLSAFISDFECFLDTYCITSVHTVILGDINLHYNCPHKTYVKQMLHLLDTRDFTQLVHTKTHKKR